MAWREQIIIGYIAIWALQMMAFVGVVYGMTAGSSYLSRRLMRARYERATVANIVVDAAGAATIPVLATFTGVRGLPWWYAVATNDAKPLLVFERDAIRFRVTCERRRRFADIACADIRQVTGAVNLDITFHGSPLTFSANLGAVPLAAHVLSLLPASVRLTMRAASVKAAGA